MVGQKYLATFGVSLDSSGHVVSPANYHSVIGFVCVVVYHMKEPGWEKIDQRDVFDLHYKYQADKK